MKPFSIEEYLKNPDRKVITRDGKPARIICTDFKNGDYPIIAAILSQNTEVLSTYTKEGSYDVFGEEKTSDLFFTSEKKEGWVNVYRHPDLEYPSCVYILHTKKLLVMGKYKRDM